MKESTKQVLAGIGDAIMAIAWFAAMLVLIIWAISWAAGCVVAQGDFVLIKTESPITARSSQIAARSSQIAARSSQTAVRSSPIAARSSQIAVRSSQIAPRPLTDAEETLQEMRRIEGLVE